MMVTPMVRRQKLGGSTCEDPIILFDGVCNLCHASVQFVIRRDPNKRFRFGTLQSEQGRQLLASYGLSAVGLTSIVLIDGGRAYMKSGAALRIAKRLDGLWPLLFACVIIPPVIRDALYDFVGNRRYRWFGTMDECWVPTEDLRDRFLT